MKIINIDVKDEIVLKNIEDVDTGEITGISSKVIIPTGNYNNIILNFNFDNPKLCEDMNMFANFSIISGVSVDVALEKITVKDKVCQYACFIPAEVFEDECEFLLGLYGYSLNEDGSLKQRVSFTTVKNSVVQGTYDPDANEGIVPSPSVFEVYFNKISNATDIFAEKEELKILQSQINNLASGSPKGVYETTSALAEANPETGVYIISVDGHVYSWTKDSEEEPIDLGVYQSTGIANNSVSYDTLTEDIKQIIGIENVDLGEVEDGFIINTMNIKYAYSGYSMSKPILLKKGQTIHISTCANTIYLSPISILSYANDGTVQYKHLTESISDTSRLYSFSYTHQENKDCYIILSFKNDMVANIYIDNNYTKEDVNTKEVYYAKNHYNLMSNLSTYGGINTTQQLVENDDDVYFNTLNVNINFDGTIINKFKYSFYKFIPTSENLKKGFGYIDVRRKSGDNVPFKLAIYDNAWRLLSNGLMEVLTSTDFVRYFIHFERIYSDVPTSLQIAFCLPDNQEEDITSLSSEVEIREMGIIYNRELYNQFDSLLTPYDYSLITKKQTTKQQDKYTNATISIIGDSYSSYGGWIPDNYLSWYRENGNELDNDVTSVEQTWWYKLIKQLNGTLLVNNSYSGSTICNTGYNGNDSTNTSFITRMKKWMGEDRKCDVKPNIIIIMGGTNDRWAGSPIGELKYSDWTEEDLKQILPAFCYMLDYLKKWNPGATIINIINTDLGVAIPNGMATACEHYDVINVAPSIINKDSGHPNQNGMNQILEAILNVL
jgi:lysophospholipase L1-like esterase